MTDIVTSHMQREIDALRQELAALRQSREAEQAARFCYLEGWNDVAHDRGADFNRAWAAWLASESAATLKKDQP